MSLLTPLGRPCRLLRERVPLMPGVWFEAGSLMV
jgi:hypothetical protein